MLMSLWIDSFAKTEYVTSYYHGYRSGDTSHDVCMIITITEETYTGRDGTAGTKSE